MTRRNMLGWAKGGAVGAVVLAGAGYGGMRWFQAHAATHDLSRIGKGKPTVVQVHDPQCQLCTQLQRATKQAMKQFGECDLLYLVADLNQTEGQAFAARHNVSRVTLVLMDAEGQATQVLRGVRSRAELETILAVHFEVHGDGVRRS